MTPSSNPPPGVPPSSRVYPPVDESAQPAADVEALTCEACGAPVHYRELFDAADTRIAALQTELADWKLNFDAMTKTAGEYQDKAQELSDSLAEAQEQLRRHREIDAAQVATTRVAEDGMRKALRRAQDAERKLSEAEGFEEAVTNLIDAYSWLSEGRGPYADTDSGYDGDVQRFTRALMDLLRGERHQPWQQVLNKLADAEARLATVTAERDALRTGLLAWASHPMECAKWGYPGKTCTCGLDALTQEAKA